MAPRRKRKKSSDHLASALTWLSVLCITSLLGVSWLLKVERDPITGCNVDTSKIENTFSFLIDATDSMTPVQIQKVENFVSRLLDTTTSEDRFQVFLLNASESDVLHPLFEGCNFKASFTEAPAISKFRQANFREQLASSLDSGEQANISPIIHGINAVSAALPTDETKKHLIVVSDMYENSSTLSLYRAGVSSLLSEGNETLTSRTPNLSGVSLYLLIIDRPGLVQDSEFAATWLRYFRERAKARIESREIGAPPRVLTLAPAERITG